MFGPARPGPRRKLHAVQDLPGAPRGTILFQRPHPNPIYQAEKVAWNRDAPPAFGAELKRRMREYFLETRTVEWESFTEFLPHAGCEVTLDPEVRDPVKQPVARVRLGLHPKSLASSDQLADRARQVISAAGALRQGDSSAERIYTVLQCGTTRMGPIRRARWWIAPARHTA